MSSNSNRYKLPPKAMHILVPFFLSFSMSAIVSFVSILRSVGASEFSFTLWLSSWMISWMIAFPSVLVLLPIVRKFALLFIRKDPPK